MEVKQSFRNMEIFTYLTHSQLDVLADLAVKVSFAKGYVFRELDPGDGMYVIETGAATVTKSTGEADGGETLIGHLHQGDSFGEISIIDGLPRSANVKANGPLECYFVPRKVLLLALKESPELALGMLRALASMVRSANNWAGAPSGVQQAYQNHPEPEMEPVNRQTASSPFRSFRL